MKTTFEFKSRRAGRKPNWNNLSWRVCWEVDIINSAILISNVCNQLGRTRDVAVGRSSPVHDLFRILSIAKNAEVWTHFLRRLLDWISEDIPSPKGHCGWQTTVPNLPRSDNSATKRGAGTEEWLQSSEDWELISNDECQTKILRHRLLRLPCAKESCAGL